ncbi:hypothetical protein EVAR_30792_1 [Eumeta japonica]|uniref:Uncharacterized protein n=1 Tax=Eumeta variegata TaxID=151549 RepID=A0A4C1V5X2_EUMVA|nr:hypothetical protein EVAR_30792_1 [Eumeta japonica]
MDLHENSHNFHGKAGSLAGKSIAARTRGRRVSHARAEARYLPSARPPPGRRGLGGGVREERSGRGRENHRRAILYLLQLLLLQARARSSGRPLRCSINASAVRRVNVKETYDRRARARTRVAENPHKGWLYVYGPSVPRKTRHEDHMADLNATDDSESQFARRPFRRTRSPARPRSAGFRGNFSRKIPWTPIIVDDVSIITRVARTKHHVVATLMRRRDLRF